MALTMVHLLAARKWARGHEAFLDDPEFYLGAISPDAIHVRDHDDKSHKDEIHLYNWRSPHPEPVIEYWRERSAPFDVGYGVHVLTDAQWVPRYASRLRGLFRADGSLDTSIYYNDCFQTDFALYRAHEWLRGIMDAVETARVPSDHPLLTFDELDQWRHMIAAAYRGECRWHDPVKNVDLAFVRAFIEESTELIDEVYARAFG